MVLKKYCLLVIGGRKIKPPLRGNCTLLKQCYQNFERHFSQILNAKTSEKWETVVGLEVHAQISSQSKLFSPSATEYLSPPNMQVSFFDAALPGTLPVLNRRCVESGVLTALSLNCTINKTSYFDRKHYFYADMPAGYQITQQRRPLATEGRLEFVVFNPAIKLGPYTKSSRLIQLQLEQDSGKSLHDENRNRSLIDLNRAGVGLMELVFDADLKDGEECAALVKELQMILKRLGTCSGLMDEGALRVDANVSVNRPGEPLGVRTEVKNLNSVRFVAKAVDYEIMRQIKELESGGIVINETRGYDMRTKLTLPMRDKEEVQDYRYMPEPNLPPLRLSEIEEGTGLVSIDALQNRLPPLPQDDRRDLIQNFKLKEETAIVLVNQEFYRLFCILMKKESRDANMLARWLLDSFLKQLNEVKLHPNNCKLDASQIGKVVDLLAEQTITNETSMAIVSLMLSGDTRSPLEITEIFNWKRISDVAELEEICKTVMEQNKPAVKKLRKRKMTALTKLLIEANVLTNGRVDPRIVKEIFLKWTEN